MWLKLIENLILVEAFVAEDTKGKKLNITQTLRDLISFAILSTMIDLLKTRTTQLS